MGEGYPHRRLDLKVPFLPPSLIKTDLYLNLAAPLLFFSHTSPTLPFSPSLPSSLQAYPREQYPFAVLYFTGSDYFNRSMRCWAINHKGVRQAGREEGGRKGVHRHFLTASPLPSFDVPLQWSLSDKSMGPAMWKNGTDSPLPPSLPPSLPCPSLLLPTLSSLPPSLPVLGRKLRDVGDRVICHDERGIFKALGLAYKHPWERNTHDAVMLVRALPPSLPPSPPFPLPFFLPFCLFHPLPACA